MNPRLAELYTIVALIPPGRATSYGTIGRILSQPVSGLTVGRWMANCPPDIPWHRIIGADRTLKTAKRDPAIAQQQKQLLQKEGIQFDEADIAQTTLLTQEDVTQLLQTKPNL